MADKKTMTLNLSEPEMAVLEALCKRKGMSKTTLLRQALRLYQSIDERLERGEKVFVEDPRSKEKAELMVL
ncbi:ribbon-helix-helix protein, CopG family [Bradyrhizobium sp. 191]|uniref:ribbon-helix-helix protein, CopG family n=1 Tax=Bradyrhizobium sp. 191 TaxID=2782659 RepID=UPI001FFE3B7E|nr:ribbon-helix-helix protein, CopG family [Bradyrhizobium sp. 191]UPJ68527.1 ribbon-helix-helix protein, CopG family [Bradyrhizobium sp. 191]